MATWRFRHDVIALILHIIASVLIAVFWSQSSTVKNSVAISAFLLQEVVAVVAHLYYLAQYRKQKTATWWNSYKWYEYGVSATAGTIGTFYAGMSTDRPDVSQTIRLVALLALGFCQQRIGLILDVPPLHGSFSNTSMPVKYILFALAFGFQIIEYSIVIHQQPPYFILFVYIFMWALFGIHAGFRLVAISLPTPSSLLRPWTDEYWTELVYSYLGWTAKISVIVVAIPDALTDLSSAATNGMYAVMAGVIVFTTVGFVVIHATFKPPAAREPLL